MLSTPPELRVTLWSDAIPATEQFTSHLLALVPRARVSAGYSPGQLCVHLEADVPVAALADLLERESAAFVYSYHWYPHPLKTPVSQSA